MSEFKIFLEEKMEVLGNKPRYEDICFLIVANGGMRVENWGVVTNEDGHQRGLDMEDALRLIYYNGVFDGIAISGSLDFILFEKYFDKYVEENNLENEYARTNKSKKEMLN